MEQVFFASLSFIIFVLYIVFIWHKYGIQKSISDSYYRLKGMYQALFTVFIWGSSLPLIIAGGTELMFIAGGLICFAGTAPAFKKTRMESISHYVGATGGYAVGFTSLLIDFGLWWLAVPAAILAAFFHKNSPYYIWSAEIIGYFTLWLGVMLNSIL